MQKKIQLKPMNGLIKKFPSIYKFYNGDINKFVLLLRKVVYPYEQMDIWEGFDETSLPDKKIFTANFNQKILLTKTTNML